MSEELKNTLKYLKNKNNTRRIKTITINEAHKVVEEIERLHSIIKEVRELLKNDYFEDGSFTNYKKVFELLDKENK